MSCGVFGVEVSCVARVGLLRSTSRLAISGLRRHLTTTLEVTSKDASFPWVLHWLKEARGAGASFKHVSVTTLNAGADAEDGPSFDLVPAPGKHVVTYGGSRAPGSKGASLSLQLDCFAITCVRTSLHRTGP